MNIQMNSPLFMAYATQKGGVGKTTFTVLTASYLHYVKGFNVLVVDCDYPQHSIDRMREREIETVSADPQLKAFVWKQFRKLDKKAYTILKASAETAEKIVGEFLNETLLSLLNLFLVPISADRVVLESSLNFAKAIGEMIKKTPKKKLYLFWNMVDKREKTELYDVYSKGITKLGLSLLETRIPDTKRYRKELLRSGQRPFRSTLFPPNKQMAKGSYIMELINEILKTLNLE